MKPLISTILICILVLSITGAYALASSDAIASNDTIDSEDIIESNDNIELYNTIEPAQEQVYTSIERYVSRLYIEALGRDYSISELEERTDGLNNRSQTAASVAYEFFFGREFLNQRVSNEEFIYRLYRALLSREPDAGEQNQWLFNLNTGWQREAVFAGFINSKEFKEFCKAENLPNGAATSSPGQINMYNVFVRHLYATILNRDPTSSELTAGRNALRNGTQTGVSFTHSLLFGTEFVGRNRTDEQYIDILFESMFGREPDAAGRATWIKNMQAGSSRYSVFVSFAGATEFNRMCSRHDITRGAVSQVRGPLDGKIIVLDPGHGTSGSPGAGSYNEAVAMLDLAFRIKPLLEAEGASVLMTRETAANVPLASRSAMINIRSLQAVRATVTSSTHRTAIDRLIGIMQGIINNPSGQGPIYMNVEPFNAARAIHPDLKLLFEYQDHSAVRNNFLAISLHTNAATSTATRGVEVYYINPAENTNTARYYTGYLYSAQSRSFGNTLINQINSIGIPRRATGLRAENYAMIRESNVPIVLAESGFHTNATDRELLSSPAFRQTLAVAYRNAVLAHYS